MMVKQNYFVLQNDNGFDANRLQSFIHSLCHIYARSITSFSYSPPAYYADRLCDRVRRFFGPWLSGANERDIRHPTAVNLQQNPPRTRERIGYDRFSAIWSPGNEGLNRNPWHVDLNEKMFWLSYFLGESTLRAEENCNWNLMFR
jgi:hypothetical protein